MTERHFHGTRHIKGGFDIDESTLHPNSAYWLACARGEYQRVVIAIGEEKANHVVPERADGQTWKDVYQSYKLIADLAENQVARSGWIEEAEADAKPEVYDFTPFPKEMPDVDFETVDEISF